MPESRSDHRRTVAVPGGPSTHRVNMFGWAMLFAAMTLFCGCGTAVQHLEACRSKVSVTLFSLLESADADAPPFEIVVTVSDTAGLRKNHPALTMPNGTVALGHLTKRQIISLCSHPNVILIDRSRTMFPQ